MESTTWSVITGTHVKHNAFADARPIKRMQAGKLSPRWSLRGKLPSSREKAGPIRWQSRRSQLLTIATLRRTCGIVLRLKTQHCWL